MAAGEEKTINVTFPENYGAANLAGKPATFDIKVKEGETVPVNSGVALIGAMGEQAAAPASPAAATAASTSTTGLWNSRPLASCCRPKRCSSPATSADPSP